MSPSSSNAVEMENSSDSNEDSSSHGGNRQQDENINTKSSFHICKEATKLFKIALPTVAVQFNVFFIFPQTASAVGRNLGTEELASFSLASLTGNMACLSVIVGVLTASDTLMPRAFGSGHYPEVGRLAIRGFCVCALVLIVPVFLLTFCMDYIFTRLGQDPFVSMAAALWLRVYVLGVPFVVLFRVLQRFLAAQHVVMPMVYASAIGCFVVHPILLRIVIPSLGFMGSALAIVITQFVQVALVMLHLKLQPIYHADTWPGLSWSYVQEAIQLEPMLRFFRLSLGGVLSFSEWWFWETVCFLAGHLGVIPLCIHTIAYNLIPVMFMIPLGMSIGLSVRMGHVLAEGSVARAKRLAMLCMGFTVSVACVAAVLLYHLEPTIVALFTSDPNVTKGCKEIWPLVCLYIVLLYVFGINSGILRALGLQWRMAAIVTVVLWGMALPTLLHVVLHKGGGVHAIWSILPCFYAFMNIVLFTSYTAADWQAISNSIRQRAQQAARVEMRLAASEQTPLNNKEFDL